MVSRFGRGLAWRKNGDHEEAITDFSKALRVDAKSLRARALRGMAWHEKQEYAKAIKDFSVVIRLDPTISEAYGYRAQSYLAKDDFENAIRDCSEVIRLDPTAAAARGNRALVHLAKGIMSKPSTIARRRRGWIRDTPRPTAFEAGCIWRRGRRTTPFAILTNVF